MSNLETAERALRDYMIKGSALGRDKPSDSKPQEPPVRLSPSEATAEYQRHIRVLNRLWRKFYEAGGKKL